MGIGVESLHSDCYNIVIVAGTILMLEELMTFVKVYYLNHSGFAVETDTKVLIFDYYKDPEKVLPRLQAGEKPFWFFVSHSHADHFNPYIDRKSVV